MLLSLELSSHTLMTMLLKLWVMLEPPLDRLPETRDLFANSLLERSIEQSGSMKKNLRAYGAVVFSIMRSQAYFACMELEWVFVIRETFVRCLMIIGSVIGF